MSVEIVENKYSDFEKNIFNIVKEFASKHNLYARLTWLNTIVLYKSRVSAIIDRIVGTIEAGLTMSTDMTSKLLKIAEIRLPDSIPVYDFEHEYILIYVYKEEYIELVKELANKIDEYVSKNYKNIGIKILKEF